MTTEQPETERDGFDPTRCIECGQPYDYETETIPPEATVEGIRTDERAKVLGEVQEALRDQSRHVAYAVPHHPEDWTTQADRDQVADYLANVLGGTAQRRVVEIQVGGEWVDITTYLADNPNVRWLRTATGQGRETVQEGRGGDTRSGVSVGTGGASEAAQGAQG